MSLPETKSGYCHKHTPCVPGIRHVLNIQTAHRYSIEVVGLTDLIFKNPHTTSKTFFNAVISIHQYHHSCASFKNDSKNYYQQMKK